MYKFIEITQMGEAIMDVAINEHIDPVGDHEVETLTYLAPERLELAKRIASVWYRRYRQLKAARQGEPSEIEEAEEVDETIGEDIYNAAEILLARKLRKLEENGKL